MIHNIIIKHDEVVLKPKHKTLNKYSPHPKTNDEVKVRGKNDPKSPQQKASTTRNRHCAATPYNYNIQQMNTGISQHPPFYHSFILGDHYFSTYKAKMALPRYFQMLGPGVPRSKPPLTEKRPGRPFGGLWEESKHASLDDDRGDWHTYLQIFTHGPHVEPYNQPAPL